MTEDEIKTAILQVCKVSGNDSDFNVLGFYALCDRLVELGVAAEREACAKVCDERAAAHPMGSDEQCEAEDCAAAIRARGNHD
jgi:hypothetical protein